MTFERVPLRRLVTCLDGRRVPLNAAERADMQGEIPYWGANGVVDHIDRALFDEELILLGEDGAPFDDPRQDVSFLVSGPVWVNNHIHVLRPNTATTDSRFLPYALNCVDWPRYISGSTRDKLTQEDMNRVAIAFPPLVSQRAIADFLDAETARIDTLIAKKLQLAARLLERTASQTSSLLLDGSLTATLPDGWRWTAARRICPQITVGVVVEPSTYFVPEGVPFIHGTDVKAGWIDESNFKYLSAGSNALLHKSQVRVGDIVAMRVGEPGRAAVVPPHLDGANCASVLIFRRSALLHSAILCAFLNSGVGRSQIEAMQYGAAQGVLNVAHALDLKVPLPPIEQQPAIVRRLQEITSIQQIRLHTLERQVALLRERRQALITAAVTGELEISGAA